MAEREKEVIVTDGGGGGGGGVIIAVVLLIAVLVVLFFLFGRDMLSGDGDTDINADVKVETPSNSRSELRHPAASRADAVASAGAPIPG